MHFFFLGSFPRLTYWSRKSTKVRKDIDETLLGLQQGGNKRKEEGQEENGGGGGDGRGRADGNTSGQISHI